ncbi:hypothetical protein ATI61_108347 [Archangium gephyra]|uniref:Uncharacterized protein n=1 Tax=Archangium gephyra TaxID=48 RepID=A0AAC8TDS2_9BACT|nr:hypothetical protein [Archangium gephyra]AKJ02265.1 Hypothetical protein AA314_03891 [Archangium gephyra]REG28805.1 hypothetical protein ATI61_108347 [Archangium gephyra]
MDWTPFIVVGFFFPLFGGHFFWQRWMKEVRRRKLDVMAAALRLEISERDVSETQARYTGRSRGNLVKLLVGPLGGVDIRITLDVPLPSGLVLRRPGRLGRDIQVGVAELDKVLQVQGAHPAGIIRFLREPALRAPLRELFTAHPGARIAGGELYLPAGALWADEHLAQAAEQASKAAQALAGTARALVSGSEPAPGWTEASEALASTDWVRETFARRARIYLVLAVSSFLALVPAFAVTMVVSWDKTLKYQWCCAWVAVTLFSWWFTARVTVCPACSGTPRRLVEDDDSDVSLSSPMVCRDCGVQLQ